MPYYDIIPDLGTFHIDIPIKLEGPHTYRTMRLLIREWTKYGVTIPEIAGKLGKPVEWVEAVLEKGKRPIERINFSFLQVSCPYCSKLILSGPANFLVSSPPQDTIESEGYCVHCRRPVHFLTARDGKAYAEAVPAVVEHRTQDSGFDGLSFTCTPGISFTTNAWSILTGTPLQYTIRVGIAIMGSMNFKSCKNMCPFDPNFHDNYVEGQAPTLEEAWKKVKDELESMTKGLFA